MKRHETVTGETCGGRGGTLGMAFGPRPLIMISIPYSLLPPPSIPFHSSLLTVSEIMIAECVPCSSSGLDSKQTMGELMATMEYSPFG
eukprot:7010960-Prymnesium_polylepis.1